MDCKKLLAPIRFLPLLCVTVLLPSAASCARGQPSRAEFVLGTVCSVTLFDQSKAGVYREVFDRLREIENRMSVNIPGTDVDKINAAAGIAPVPVHEDVFLVIERALFFADISGGGFDPTVGPLVSLWGIGGDSPRVPSREEIDAVLPLINWRDVELDYGGRSVFLKRRGMALDLGAIAKGYAADEAAAIIKRSGIKRAIIDLGGNIVTCGEKKNKKPWAVGIQNPNGNRGVLLGLVQTPEQSVVTSGVYERFFEAEGARYHHIFSPSQGYPSDTGLLSVTVTAFSSMDADALSTAVFVLGYEKGRRLIESIPGTEAVFVFADLKVRKTPGVNFTLTDNSFRLEQ